MNANNLPEPNLSEPDQDRLLDGMRGELGARAQRTLDARLEDEPDLRAEAERLGAFLRLARTSADPAPEPGMATRVALRIRDQVAREEAAAVVASRSVPTRRAWWSRVLAVSVAAHVLLLAFLSWQEHSSTQPGGPGPHITYVLPAPGLQDEALAAAEAPEPIWPEVVDPSLPHAAVEPLPKLSRDDTELALAPLDDAVHDHPRAVALEMAVRRIDDLKRRRLDRYGLDAQGTLRKVALGLDRIATRQRGDGSFAPGGGRGPVGQTGLALLPFLAEGESSRVELGDRRVAAAGVRWLRRTLFDAEGRLKDGLDARPSDLGIALRALSEDYMLSYGRLLPAAAARRVAELQALSDGVQATQAADGSFPGSNDDLRLAVWPMWGMEAAIRTGAVRPPKYVPERFRTWFANAEPSDPQVVAAGLLLSRGLGASYQADAGPRVDSLIESAGEQVLDPFWLAVAGSGLLLQDPTAYRAWNDEFGQRLLDGLSPQGLVWAGDPVGDTALQLLALQVAYRTY